MKSFNIATNLELNRKPYWLDSFREKFDQAYPYHVTLKTNTRLENGTENDVHKIISGIAKKYKPLEVLFNRLNIKTTSKGECIMIFATKNKKLKRLQSEISEKLSAFGRHATKEYEKFENHFQPHITIARRLSVKQNKKAIEELGEDLNCEARIVSLTVTFVEKDNFKNWSNPDNKKTYKLYGKE